MAERKLSQKVTSLTVTTALFNDDWYQWAILPGFSIQSWSTGILHCYRQPKQYISENEQTNGSHIYVTVSQKTFPALSISNFKKNDPISIIFGRNIPDRTGHQMTILFPTSSSLCRECFLDTIYIGTRMAVQHIITILAAFHYYSTRGGLHVCGETDK